LRKFRTALLTQGEVIRYYLRGASQTDLGRLQFFIQQTTGNKPEVPDSYYNTLVEGKHKLDFLVEEYRKMYYNGEWWGTYQIEQDWIEYSWIVPYLLKWKKNYG